MAQLCAYMLPPPLKHLFSKMGHTAKQRHRLLVGLHVSELDFFVLESPNDEGQPLWDLKVCL